MHTAHVWATLCWGGLFSGQPVFLLPKFLSFGSMMFVHVVCQFPPARPVSVAHCAPPCGLDRNCGIIRGGRTMRRPAGGVKRAAPCHAFASKPSWCRLSRLVAPLIRIPVWPLRGGPRQVKQDKKKLGTGKPSPHILWQGSTFNQWQHHHYHHGDHREHAAAVLYGGHSPVPRSSVIWRG